MRNILMALAASMCVAAIGPGDAFAYIMIAREPVVNRVALADVIVMGKITAVRPATVRARIYPRENNPASKFEFLLADLEVSEVIAGPRDIKRLAIAFVHLQVTANQYKPAPAAGLAGCFFAVKHFDEDFHVVPIGGYCDPSAKAVQDEMPLIRRCAKLLDDPAAGLKSKEPGDALLTAHLMALRFNYAPLRWFGLGVQGRDVDAELSRLFLETLATATWADPDEKTRASAAAALGWVRAGARQANLAWPDDFPRIEKLDDPAAAPVLKKWLAEHLGTYRLQRLVPAKTLEITRPATRGKT